MWTRHWVPVYPFPYPISLDRRFSIQQCSNYDACSTIATSNVAVIDNSNLIAQCKFSYGDYIKAWSQQKTIDGKAMISNLSKISKKLSIWSRTSPPFSILWTIHCFNDVDFVAGSLKVFIDFRLSRTSGDEWRSRIYVKCDCSSTISRSRMS